MFDVDEAHGVELSGRRAAGQRRSDLHSRDDAIVNAIMNRSDGRFDRDVVRWIVVDFVEEFDGSPIQTYIPVLVTKKTIDELWRLDRSLAEGCSTNAP